MQSIREQIRDVINGVLDKTYEPDSAISRVDSIMESWIGPDEVVERAAKTPIVTNSGKMSSFPDRWGGNDKDSAKRTWTYGRNHLKRSLRSTYKG